MRAAPRRSSHGSDLRLDRLRDLAAQLERLPSSRERDFMIKEIRARAVDVETGETPSALRTLEPETPQAPPAPAKARRPREAACPVPEPAPVTVAIAKPEPAPEPAPKPAFEVVLGGGVLWADEPEPEGENPRPWTRGLRG
jgi:hypothetical protein